MFKKLVYLASTLLLHIILDYNMYIKYTDVYQFND